MGRKKKDRVGERFISKESLGMCKFVIVEYNSSTDLWIEFLDEHKAKVHTTYQNCRIGQVKNPYHPSVCDVGCLGIMSNGSEPKAWENDKVTREYFLWRGMLQRCYDPKFQEKNPTYKGCEVDERWLIYANFLEDLPLIEGYELWLNNDDYALDKDLKQQGIKNKVYSLNTVCFVANSENTRESNERCGHPSNASKIRVYGINVKTGEKTKVFNSMKDVERELGVSQGHISGCLKVDDNRKSAGGYKWYKVD